MASKFERRSALAQRAFESTRQKVSRRADWAQAKKRLRAAAASQSRGLVRVDPALQATIQKFLDQVAPEISRAFNRRIVPFAQATFDAWPTDTGYSKAVLGLSFKPVRSGRAFVGELADEAYYAGFIDRGRLVRRLFAAGEEVAERVAADIASDLGR